MTQQQDPESKLRLDTDSGDWDKRITEQIEITNGVQSTTEPKDPKAFEFAYEILTGPKRHHFVTEAYQLKFARKGAGNGVVWVYDRRFGQYRCDQPKNVAVEGYYYAFNDPEDRRRFDIESMFSAIESWAMPVINSLESKGAPTEEQRDRFCLFVAAAHVRTPDHIESMRHINGEMVRHVAKFNFSSVERTQELMEAAQKDGFVKTETENGAKAAKELFDFVHDGEYIVETDKQFALSLMMQQLPTIAECIYGLNWLVLHSPAENKSFVTSDSPVILAPPAGYPKELGVGFATPDTTIYFPLSASACLVLSGKGDRCEHRLATPETIRRINLMVTAACHRFVIARDEALVKSLVTATGIDKKEWQPKYRMG